MLPSISAQRPTVARSSTSSSNAAALPSAPILADAGTSTPESFTIAEGFTPETRANEGRTVGDIAVERAAPVFDTLLDIVLADDLRTGLRPQLPSEDRATWGARAAVWKDPRAVVGASDAGAHLDMFCMAGYSTFLVGPAVRKLELLTIEEAVHLLTDVPASLYGLDGRGTLKAGAHADVVINGHDHDFERFGPQNPDGKADKVAGKVQNAIGGLKDTLRGK